MTIAELESVLNAAVETLGGVTTKKMFGCHAWWVDGNVFALVWKHGRIGVKLPDEDTYSTLMRTAGATPWKAGAMQMAHWVLVPEAFHAKQADLRKWTKRAHELCSKLEKKKSQNAKSSPSRAKSSTSASITTRKRASPRRSTRNTG